MFNPVYPSPINGTNGLRYSKAATRQRTRLSLLFGNFRALAFRSKQRRVGSTTTVWKRESLETGADYQGEQHCNVMGKMICKLLRSN